MSRICPEAAEEWLRYVEHDRDRKPSTIAGYRALLRSQLLPTFGELPIESITTPMVERWIASVDRSPATRTKALVLMHGIFKRARKLYGLPLNPVADVEKPPARQSGDIDVFSPEEVMALVRAATSEQDAAIYLTAAFTGLRRGELLALRWRDVDFSGQVIRVRASYAEGTLTTPKSGKVRSVPRPWRSSASASTGPEMTISSSSARPAAISTAAPCAAATTLPSREPISASSASTTSATPSAPA